MHQFFIDGISDNMASLVESEKYGAINTTDTSTNAFYVIMFTSGAYTLQNNKTIDGQIITAGELVGKAKYLCSMQIDTNWYWSQQPKHHVITVRTRTNSIPCACVACISMLDKPWISGIPSDKKTSP